MYITHILYAWIVFTVLYRDCEHFVSVFITFVCVSEYVLLRKTSQPGFDCQKKLSSLDSLVFLLGLRNLLTSGDHRDLIIDSTAMIYS